jgi:hypothetical protein
LTFLRFWQIRKLHHTWESKRYLPIISVLYECLRAFYDWTMIVFFVLIDETKENCDKTFSKTVDALRFFWQIEI